ncbi:MAG: endolytic transglycosylase MltG [Candidatus Margulisbacteria bacterium]|nr:endolytic transglycosylase MltG [Candidatus Margulisiibacteriota bacterium]
MLNGKNPHPLSPSPSGTCLSGPPAGRAGRQGGGSFMRQRVRIFVLIVLCVLIFGILLLAASLSQSSNPLDRTKYRIIIPEGASSRTVAQILEKEEILKPNSSFVFMAKVLGMSKHIQAGKYEFSPSDSLWQILIKLRRGAVIPADQIKVTFPEGASIYKMGEILRAAGYSEADQFQALVQEGIGTQLRQKYWHIFKYIPSESLEGYLYPDTYWFFKDARPAALADAMLKRFDAMVMPFWKTAAKDTKFNLHEILTLASIIEKEAKLPQEKAVISSVFHNRLRIGMPLAADPTVKYALERPTKKVYLGQLEINSLYNTYKRRGLPPGPICNPGIESIKAAVYPAKTNYLYFVAKKDGSHIFSASWDAHQRARQINR